MTGCHFTGGFGGVNGKGKADFVETLTAEGEVKGALKYKTTSIGGTL